jgi:hypothetical protein
MKPNRTQLALGVILILLGAWFVAARTVPGLEALVGQFTKGPLAVVLAGALIFLVGLILGAPGMAIPAAIVAGIGGILYYQELAEDPSVWSYMWTLIPGFVGVGNILSGLLGGGTEQVRSGFKLIGTSAVLFLIFAAIFGKLSALLGPYGTYVPAALLIIVGLWVIVRSFVRKE